MRRQVAAFVGACVLFGAGVVGAGPRVQVRGASRIELHAFGPSERVTLTGVVRDEVGAAIPRARVALSAVGGGGEVVPWVAVSPCGREVDAREPSGHGDHPVDADDGGQFCVVAALGRGHADLRAVFGGDGLHDGTRTQIVWDAAQRATSLSFSPRPERLDLEREHQRVVVSASTPPDVRPGGLRLELRDERGELLQTASTDDAGLAVFEFATSRLSGPGIGTLAATFPGLPTLSSASSSTTVTRTARVRVAPEHGRLQGDARSGVAIRVRATTLRGRVSGGSVEARLDEEVVGAATLSDGEAEIVATFAPPRGVESVSLGLRYVSDGPFHQPGEPAVVTVGLLRTSGWVRLVPVAVAVLVAGWLLRGWRRPRRVERERGVRPSPTGVASVEVLGRPRESSTWTGRVVDAHDGTGVAGARVRVLAPSFVELDVVVETPTDSQGGFEFEVHSVVNDLRLRVEAPLHAELERPLPPAADLVVSVVSRRRMLLQRMVDWARRAGKPWDQPPEPTPGQVARVARAQQRRPEVVTWAETVERKAYGPGDVDARAEREVRALEPGRQAPR